MGCGRTSSRPAVPLYPIYIGYITPHLPTRYGWNLHGCMVGYRDGPNSTYNRKLTLLIEFHAALYIYRYKPPSFLIIAYSRNCFLIAYEF